MHRRLSSKVHYTHRHPSKNLLTPSQHENVPLSATHSLPSHLTHPDRTKRVKDARNEAQKEIDDYKKEKDNEYQKFESEVRMDVRMREGTG
jgi:hypothetical protein